MIKKFINERKIHILMQFLSILIITIILRLLALNSSIILFINSIIVLSFIIPFCIDYYKRNRFFKIFNYTVSEIDNKMYISELIKDAGFIEAELFIDELYYINKYMIELVNGYKKSYEDFKEYIEMWCHEIKTPLSTLKLISENNKKSLSLDIVEELEEIEKYIEQVLYYSKCKIVGNDYKVKQISLNTLVNNVVRRNKREILERKINININNLDVVVNSDKKWLEFILNQIVSNAIKYKSPDNSCIKIETVKNNDNIILHIEDNGIGINADELDLVFLKSFTGDNGRRLKSSTGMGLYICKKLADNLGHKIDITSEKSIFTRVSIIFPLNSMTLFRNLTEL